MSKIYCFINGGQPGWHPVVALAEDGTFLGSHLSSTPEWARHDIGYTNPKCQRHERYAKHYPAGYEMEWVDDIDNHEGVKATIILNQKDPEQ